MHRDRLALLALATSLVGLSAAEIALVGALRLRRGLARLAGVGAPRPLPALDLAVLPLAA